jgi:hypothetical protein
MIKSSDIGRFLGGLLLVAALGFVVWWRVTSHAPPHPVPAPPVRPPVMGCGAAGWEAASAANGQSLDHLVWSPFGRLEVGWRVYAPLIEREIGYACPPATQGFASAYAPWQHHHGRPEDGVFKPDDFRRMLVDMELRRPFVQLTAKGICPPPPAPQALATATPNEAYGGKAVQLRAGALAAYRRMVSAARAQGLAKGANVLKLVSGFRGPAEEASRCADGGCNTVTRAHCSAHRTGLALDLYLPHAPGEDPTATDDGNRLAMVRSPEYRWLVANADRFGFLPYPYEPWHWEWTGEPP